MKISGLLGLTLIVILPFIECSLTSYIKDIPIVNSLAKKTHDVTSYLKGKGNRLKNRFTSYFDMGDSYVEAERRMTTPNLLAYHGYAAETHTVVTDDGYILSVHRIPHSKHAAYKRSPQKTVLLHHGVLGSSADWIIAGPEKGLAYLLSNSGYDVWMANVRGNTYSRAHISRSIDSYAFWNFTFHEVGYYDLPAVIDYIMDIKGGDVKINYVGFSMGTTVLFTLLSSRKEYNNILNAGFALAPIAYMTNIKSPLKSLAKYSSNMEYWMNMFGANQFLPRNKITTRLSQHAYKFEDKGHKGVILKNLFFVLCGYDEKQFNKSLVPVIINHVPAGTSTKTLIHYSQEINEKGEFQKFDYGVTGNLKQYGTLKPPKYSLNEITLPIALLNANNDWLSSTEDVRKLYNKLRNPIEHYVVPYKDFNHLDFLWGIDAPTLVYDKLLQLLETHNSVKRKHLKV